MFQPVENLNKGDTFQVQAHGQVYTICDKAITNFLDMPNESPTIEYVIAKGVMGNLVAIEYTERVIKVNE